MKNLNLPLAIISLILLLGSCHPNKDKTFSGLTIQIREENFERNVTLLSDMITVVGVVPLETSPDCVIGEISKVVMTPDRIYIVDLRRAKSVFIFNRQGRFINKIAPNGKGPMDIVAPQDIVINPLTNELLVLDVTGKYNTYSEDGQWIGSTKLGFYASHFEFLGTDKFVFACQREYLFNITDLQGKILSTRFKYEPDFQMELMKPLVKYGGQIFFHRFIDDTLYQLNGNRLEPQFVIDFGARRLSRETYINSPNVNGDRQYGEKYIRDFYLPGILKTHLVFMFAIGRKAYFNIYNRAENKLFTVATAGVKDDIFNGGADIFRLSNTFENHFIGKIEPNRMKVFSPIVFNNTSYNVAVDDNPLVILYDFRK